MSENVRRQARGNSKAFLGEEDGGVNGSIQRMVIDRHRCHCDKKVGLLGCKVGMEGAMSVKIGMVA